MERYEHVFCNDKLSSATVLLNEPISSILKRIASPTVKSLFLCHQVGRSVDETLRLVQAFQYTDKHGEVCPAGWKPGADTIVPDPKEKLDYFTKHDEEVTGSPNGDEL